MSSKAARLSLRVDKTAYGGEGLALHEGKVYFVEGALPGEEVEAAVVEEKKNFGRARAVRVLRASPHRVEPACRYAARCGGCQYQHVDYPGELALKEAQLEEIFRPLPGAASAIRPIVPSPSPTGYRNSLTLHPIPQKGSKTAVLGFVAKDNVSKVAVAECQLADPRLAPVLAREYSVRKATDKMTFRVAENGQVVGDGDEAFLRVRLAGESLLTSSKGFFQNNLAVAGLLAEKTAAWTRAVSPDVFFDLYAGVGAFSFTAGKLAPKTVAVEESPSSVAAMRMNREERKAASMTVVEGRVEKKFPDIWEKEATGRALILLDPPRQGLAPELARFLSKVEAAALVYVSCDPATLARDLKVLLEAGRWRLSEIAPFDMFPRTKHIETAVLLRRAD